MVSRCYLCVGVGCVVCLSQNAEEKLQVVSPLVLCPSLWLSGKSQTVLSMSSIVQKVRLAWAKKAAFELHVTLRACWRISCPPKTKVIMNIQTTTMENTKQSKEFGLM